MGGAESRSIRGRNWVAIWVIGVISFLISTLKVVSIVLSILPYIYIYTHPSNPLIVSTFFSMPLYICGSNGGNSHGADPAIIIITIIIVIISIGGAAVSVVVLSTGRVGVQIGWGGGGRAGWR